MPSWLRWAFGDFPLYRTTITGEWFSVTVPRLYPYWQKSFSSPNLPFPVEFPGLPEQARTTRATDFLRFARLSQLLRQKSAFIH